MSLFKNRQFIILLGSIVILIMLFTLNSIRSNNNFRLANIAQNSEASTEVASAITISPQTSLKSLTYPNSNGDASDLNHLELTSSDSPKEITDWYKKMLTDLGYSTTNFVATSQNNNINNKLEAVGEKKITVEVSKNATATAATVKVNLE